MISFKNKTSLICCILCFFIICISYVLEYILKMQPCPLCFIQRILFIFLNLFFIFLILKKQTFFNFVIYICIILFSFLGIYLSIKQLLLQYSNHSEISSCLAGFNTIIKVLPILDAINLIVQGTKECSKPDFIFGINIIFYNLSFYIFFIIISIFNIYLIKNNN